MTDALKPLLDQLEAPWSTTGKILLRCGEMSAGELRVAKAVARAVLADARTALEALVQERDANAKDAERWRMLPAFIEEHQIEYMPLKRQIDAAIAEQKAADY